MSATEATSRLTEDQIFCDAESEPKLQNLSINTDFVTCREGNYEVSDEELDDEDYEEYQDDFAIKGSTVRCTSVSNKPAFQPNEQLLRKYNNKINVEKYEGPALLPGHAANLLREKQRQSDHERIRIKDKHDRATVEQVRILNSCQQ